MSIAATTHVLDTFGDAEPIEKLVALALADAHDETSGLVVSRIDWIAEWANMTSPYVRKVIDRLIEKGYIEEVPWRSSPILRDMLNEDSNRVTYRFMRRDK